MGFPRSIPVTHFARPELARKYCDELSGAGSAIFGKQLVLLLAAPEGVGKTSFLLHDLLPEADSRGWVVLYLDMQEVGLADPDLALRQLLAPMARQLASPGPVPELESGAITGWFEAIVQTSGRPVMLVIDEAQHLLNTEAGRTLTFSLKAARDAINMGGGEFYQVFTGSQRSKMSQMANTKQAAFYLSPVLDFPSLGYSYVLRYVERLNAALNPSSQLNVSILDAAFTRLGSRPEAFVQLMGRVLPFLQDERFPDVLNEAIEQALEEPLKRLSQRLNALTPIQRAVFTVLARREKGESTYGEVAMGRYAAELRMPVKVESVQSAIKALQEMGLIWSPGRGRYELEDLLFRDLFEQEA